MKEGSKTEEGNHERNKVAGGKVLRNKTRSAAQEDVISTTAARIAEHQRELHAARQRDGLAKYSEEGGGEEEGREGRREGRRGKRREGRGRSEGRREKRERGLSIRQRDLTSEL